MMMMMSGVDWVRQLPACHRVSGIVDSFVEMPVNPGYMSLLVGGKAREPHSDTISVVQSPVRVVAARIKRLPPLSDTDYATFSYLQ